MLNAKNELINKTPSHAFKGEFFKVIVVGYIGVSAIRFFLVFFSCSISILSSQVEARVASCFAECQELFRELSFNSPLIGIIYLVTPIFCLVIFGGNKRKAKDRSENVAGKGLGHFFYALALVFVLILVLFETQGT